MTPDQAAALGAATVALAVLPALSLLVLPRRDKATTRLRILAVVALTVLVMRVGAWSYASVHLRNAGGLALLVGTIGAGVRGRMVTLEPERWRVVAAGIVAAVFVALDVWAFSASWLSSGKAMDVHLPLGRGAYCVLQGGDGPMVSPTHAKGALGEQTAVDLVRLGDLGGRGTKLVPRALEEFASFGAPVVAPCDGDVVSVESALPDQPAGRPDPTHPSGNHVVVRCESGLVKLAHLQHESVKVAVGKRVKPGQELARMGSSGDAAEPHLHMGGFAKDAPMARVLATHGDLPLRFEGHFLVTNTEFTIE